ncbi:MAG: ABC transporter ATP-binding protein [Pseudomonadales bacterium]|jgi:ABC-2 type transport system ATP-binding protein
MTLIEARGLRKTFGNVTALNGLDLNVAPGRIVGLIGPNGSGKTTALKAILGLSRLDAGQLEVLGMNPDTQRKALMQRTAYIADVGILPRWMRVGQLLDFVGGVHPSFERSVAEATLAQTDVRLEKKIGGLSKGMNAQLHLAIILAIQAELLVLDEPTLGLDIIYRQRFYDSVLNDYFTENRSILITTHEVREIEHILTDVVFIHQGRNVLNLTMDSLAEEFSTLTVATAQAEPIRALGPIAEKQTLQGTQFIFRGQDRQKLSTHGEVSTPNLPELFIAVMGDH